MLWSTLGTAVAQHSLAQDPSVSCGLNASTVAERPAPPTLLINPCTTAPGLALPAPARLPPIRGDERMAWTSGQMGGSMMPRPPAAVPEPRMTSISDAFFASVDDAILMEAFSKADSDGGGTLELDEAIRVKAR